MKEQFVSTVSHELRTPLTSIAGSLGLLNGGAAGALPDKASSLVLIAAKNAERLKRLVNDLLDLDSMDAGRLAFHLSETDLRGVMRDVIEQNGPFAEEAGVSLHLAMADQALIARTDPDRLFQAVTNLVSNAAKFSPAGSTVTLSLDMAGDRACIRVTDQGPGIPADFRHRLFDRFARSDDSRDKPNLPGTGLGLAISKSLIERLGGTIRLDDAVAQGAAFEILLPLRAAQAA
jgi:signal transduction histidine kinase